MQTRAESKIDRTSGSTKKVTCHGKKIQKEKKDIANYFPPLRPKDFPDLKSNAGYDFTLLNSIIRFDTNGERKAVPT